VKQEGLIYFTDTHLTVLGLLLFFLFFIVMLFRVCRKSAKSYYEELSLLPLKDGDHHE
jgi:cytochrome c oxidase cbb3-type subunit 4